MFKRRYDPPRADVFRGKMTKRILLCESRIVQQIQRGVNCGKKNRTPRTQRLAMIPAARSSITMPRPPWSFCRAWPQGPLTTSRNEEEKTQDDRKRKDRSEPPHSDPRPNPFINHNSSIVVISQHLFSAMGDENRNNKPQKNKPRRLGGLHR